MADYAEIEDYLNVGAYKAGSNPRIDEAIAKRDALEAFLIQNVDEKAPLAETLKIMGDISGVNIPEDEIKAYSKAREFPVIFPDNDGEEKEEDEEEDEENPEIETGPAAGEAEEAVLPEEGAPDLPLMDF
jgi:hypothetical protein